MKKLILASLLIMTGLSLPCPSAAAPPDGNYYPGLPDSDTNPRPAKCVVWNGTTYVNCSSSGGGGGGGGGAVTAAANAYASGYSPDLGTPSDSPYAGTGNSTLIATVRGVYAVDSAASTAAATAAANARTDAGAINSSVNAVRTALGSPEQAGATKPVTIASGADVTEGTPSDAAYSGSNTATLVALLKATIAGLAAPNQQLPAGLGSKTSASSLSVVPASDATTPAIAAGTNTIGNVLRSLPYNDTTTALAASATFSGTSRDIGSAAGTATPWNQFSCFARADQAGTLNLQASNDNSNWYTEQTVALQASTPAFLVGRIYTRYHRCQVVNGATAETSLFVNSQFGE